MRHRCWNATRTCWNSWKPVAKSGSKDSRIESYGPIGVQSRVAVARGRWNSPDCQFEVLNTSLEPEGADAEFEAFWSLFEQRPNRRALNWKLRVRLMRVVELGYDDLERLGVGPADYGARTRLPSIGWSWKCGRHGARSVGSDGEGRRNGGWRHSVGGC